MVRLSNYSKALKEEAATELVSAIKRFQDAVDLFDTTAARSLGMNSTDLRCLAALYDHGPINARAVASKLGLTRGATTTALDRLQQRHFIARSPDEDDGRGIIIALTKRGRACVDGTWGPMRERGSEHLRSYSVQELQLFRRFFDRSSELQATCTERLPRGLAAKPTQKK